MTTATAIKTECPEWCIRKEIEDHAEDGHTGATWPSLPVDGGFNSLEIYTGANSEGQIIVNVSAGNSAELTAEEALQAGRNLIEAGQWALAHGVTA